MWSATEKGEEVVGELRPATRRDGRAAAQVARDAARPVTARDAWRALNGRLSDSSWPYRALAAAVDPLSLELGSRFDDIVNPEPGGSQ